MRKRSPALFTVQGGGVDLNIAHILQGDTVLDRQCKAVAGNVWIVGRALKQPADAAGSQDNVLGQNATPLAELILAHNAVASVVPLDQVDHSGLGNKGNVASVLGNGQQGGGDLLAGLVLVVENAVVAVGALTGVVKVAVFLVSKSAPSLMSVPITSGELQSSLAQTPGCSHNDRPSWCLS